MTHLKDLVWSKTGLVLTKDEIFENEYDKMFFEKIDETIYGIEKETVWFQKYNDERFFDTEKEALEDCCDYSEIEEENMILGKRLRELDLKQ